MQLAGCHIMATVRLRQWGCDQAMGRELCGVPHRVDPMRAAESGSGQMMSQFEGKVVLVTGAASGIGRASAVAFARAGAKTVVADVGVEGGEETVRSIKE